MDKKFTEPGEGIHHPRQKDARLKVRKWEPPRILWTDELQTLGYTCKGGTYPTSGSNCPP